MNYRRLLLSDAKVLFDRSRETRNNAKDLRQAADYIKHLEHVISELVGLTTLKGSIQIKSHVSMTDKDKREIEADFPGLVFCG